MKYTEKMIELASELGMQQARAQALEDDLTAAHALVELRDLEISEKDSEIDRIRRRAERAEAERDDARDEINGVELPPGLAAGARRARKTMRRGIVAQSGEGR